MNTLSKLTHAQAVKLQNVTNEQLIQALFDLNQDDYSELKFDSGIRYAKRLTDSDEVGFDFLVKTRFYWQWWKNEWAKRDEEFIDKYSVASDLSVLYDQYLFIHNIARLKSDQLMQKKTASMVGHAMDEYLRDYRKELVK